MWLASSQTDGPTEPSGATGWSRRLSEKDCIHRWCQTSGPWIQFCTNRHQGAGLVSNCDSVSKHSSSLMFAFACSFQSYQLVQVKWVTWMLCSLSSTLCDSLGVLSRYLKRCQIGNGTEEFPWLWSSGSSRSLFHAFPPVIKVNGWIWQVTWAIIPAGGRGIWVRQGSTLWSQIPFMINDLQKVYSVHFTFSATNI